MQEPAVDVVSEQVLGQKTRLSSETNPHYREVVLKLRRTPHSFDDTISGLGIFNTFLGTRIDGAGKHEFGLYIPEPSRKQREPTSAVFFVREG